MRILTRFFCGIFKDTSSHPQKTVCTQNVQGIDYSDQHAVPVLKMLILSDFLFLNKAASTSTVIFFSWGSLYARVRKNTPYTLDALEKIHKKKLLEFSLEYSGHHVQMPSKLNQIR